MIAQTFNIRKDASTLIKRARGIEPNNNKNPNAALEEFHSERFTGAKKEAVENSEKATLEEGIWEEVMGMLKKHSRSKKL